MYTYMRIVKNLYLVYKNDEFITAVSSFAHAKIYCNNLNK